MKNRSIPLSRHVKILLGLFVLLAIFGCSENSLVSENGTEKNKYFTQAADQTSVKYEAETYSAMSGIQTETCQDAGGGLNVGWIDAGDWLEYTVSASVTGNYTIDFRVAALSASGVLDVAVDGAVLTTLTLPVTGGWQSWQTVTTSTIALTAGNHTLRLKAKQGGFNINWFRLNSIVTSSSSSTTVSSTSKSSTSTTSSINSSSPGALKVQNYQNGPAVQNQVYLRLKLFNTGNSPISLSTIKVRYYFSYQGSTSYHFSCDYSPVGSVNVTGTFGTLPYLETGFTSAAGSLAPGASIEIQSRIWKSDWSNIDNSLNYSYNPTTAYADNSKLTAYVSGLLSWGIEPGSSSSSSSSLSSAVSSSSSSSSSSASAGFITRKVFVINFDPILATKGNQRLHSYAGWSDPYTLTTNYISDLKESSGNYVRFEIYQFTNVNAFPVKADGFQYTESTYLASLANNTGWHQPDGVDYLKIAQDFNLNALVANGTIHEVIIWGGPYFGYYESQMLGNTAYWCNSPGINQPGIPNYVIMGLNYERGVAEAIHSFGHRLESIMSHVYGGWSSGSTINNLWDKFTKFEMIAPGIASCGNVHFPPNGTSDYDYGNMTPVQSDADDWLYNYPEFKGTKRIFDSSEWSSDHRQYLRWWFNHIPRKSGFYSDGKLNNWWEYIVNMNSYPESR